MSMVWRNMEGSGIATVRISGEESIKLFQEMVRRANNCWDTAPTEMKEFSDMVTEGKLLQNYSGQPNFAKKQDVE